MNSYQEFKYLNERQSLTWHTSLKLLQEDTDILTYINPKEITLMIFILSIKKNLDADEFPI